MSTIIIIEYIHKKIFILEFIFGYQIKKVPTISGKKNIILYIHIKNVEIINEKKKKEVIKYKKYNIIIRIHK